MTGKGCLYGDHALRIYLSKDLSVLRADGRCMGAPKAASCILAGGLKPGCVGMASGLQNICDTSRMTLLRTKPYARMVTEFILMGVTGLSSLVGALEMASQTS